jgi:hypothetical protein
LSLFRIKRPVGSLVLSKAREFSLHSDDQTVVVANALKLSPVA